MVLRKFMLGGAAVAAMAVGAALAPSDAPSFVSPAEAQANVSINIGNFYDDLASEGDWVNYNGSYVFVPAGADPRWRPYTRGHWEYTKRYGWIWVSDDRHGWATHHYGRWGHAPAIGWYWVPDTVWGPAWVDWRRDDEYVAWAPLAPGGNGVQIVVDPVPVPDYYWAAVAAPNFLAANLSVDLIRDDRLYDVVRRTRPIGFVRPRGNTIIVNNFIDINFIERRTKRRVKVREVREARNRGQAGRIEGDAIEIYNPRVERKRDAKPRKTETIEQVARQKREKNPDFAAKVEERQKRRALKRDAVEADQAEQQKQKDKSKEAATQPGEGQADEATSNQKQREERAAKRKQREEEQAAKKKQREERAAKQPDADEEATTGQQKQRDERAAKRKQREEEQAARKKQRQDAKREQQNEAKPAKREERKKKQQQENQSSNEAPAQQSNAQQANRKAEQRQERQAKREANKKKKNQTEEPQQ